MKYDVYSHCDTLTKKKQDRGINQGEQTLFLSKIKTILSDFQTSKLGVISRMYAYLFVF